MVYRQQLTASEAPSEGIALRRRLLQHKTKGLRRGILLPDDFIAAVERFAERNVVHEKEVCPRCLKAYMLEAGREHELSDDAKELIATLFPEEAGHVGYYLDEKEVRPVQAELKIY